MTEEFNYIDRRMAIGWLKYCGKFPPPPYSGQPQIDTCIEYCTLKYLCRFAYFVYFRGKPACYLNKYGVKEGWLGKMSPQNYTSKEPWLIRCPNPEEIRIHRGSVLHNMISQKPNPKLLYYLLKLFANSHYHCSRLQNIYLIGYFILS